MNRIIYFLNACIILTIFPIHFLLAQHIDTSSNNSIRKDTPNFKKFSRPEEIGKSLIGEPINQLIDSLKLSKNIIQQRKTAKELGDRCILKKINLTEPQKNIISIIVEGYLDNTKSENSNTREESKQQIERLWLLAVPTLLIYINDNDIGKAELAAKSLILMRNEDIIKAIINLANNNPDINKRNRLKSILLRMQEQRSSIIPGRVCLGPEESTKLYNTLVLPAIEKLKK
jgi:hypothetical protein